MAEKGLPAPTPKPGKTKIPVANQTTKKTNISLEPKVIIRPIDYNQGQNALNPPNQPVQLPKQLPHIPNPPHPLPIPAYLQNQQNLPNLPNQSDQPNLPNQQNLPDQPDQQNLPNPQNPPNPQTHLIHQTHLICQINQIQWICQTSTATTDEMVLL